jgi:serine/threonine protein kinase
MKSFTEVILHGLLILKKKQCSQIVKQILLAVQYLNLYGIMHRDIKPENILISSGICKLSDFGTAAPFSTFHKRRLTYCGTPDYMAPEVAVRSGRGNHFNENQSYDEKCDIWSIGILAYELCAGKTPFENISDQNILFN